MSSKHFVAKFRLIFKFNPIGKLCDIVHDFCNIKLVANKHKLGTIVGLGLL